jgi:hypothetical protein
MYLFYHLVLVGYIHLLALELLEVRGNSYIFEFGVIQMTDITLRILWINTVRTHLTFTKETKF